MRVLLVALLLLLGATPAAATTPATTTPAAVAAAAAVPAVAAAAPLGGGSILTSASYRCTAAFAATSGTTASLVTGPCATTGTQLYSNGVLVGPVAAVSTTGAYALVTVSNTTAWTLVPWIPVGTTQHVISGSTETPVGGSVCLLDGSLGQQCGVITAKNVTVNFGGGAITGLTRTNICMSAGSAIAFVSGGQAQGVPVGGSSCTTSGVSYFLPIKPILSAYGLTLVTG
jgi:streptogrisin C